MKKEDFRKLSISAQAALRRVAIRALDQGKKQEEIAKLIGVTRQTISVWVNKRKRGDRSAISGGLRGRKNGDKRRLDKTVCKKVQDAISNTKPEDHGITAALWTRKSINELIKINSGNLLPLSTIGKYLERWGYTAQKPKKLAYEQQPKQVQEWLNNKYPEIVKEAHNQDADIHWCDEVGIKSESQVLKSYSAKGKTPIYKHRSKRFSINMVSTVTNNGKLRFMLYEETLKADNFVEFLRRLTKYTKKKIFLILDNLKVHHSKKVSNWVERHKSKIALFFLPPYTPQYNPDEYLNNDLKRNVNKRRIPLTKDELKSNLKSYLRLLQNNPVHVKNFFKAHDVKYAA